MIAMGILPIPQYVPIANAIAQCQHWIFFILDDNDNETIGILWHNWWLVRVSLVVDWWFLPRTFGLVVGTYEGLLPFCECTWGGGSMFKWWGHLNPFCLNQTFRPFCTKRWWGAKN